MSEAMVDKIVQAVLYEGCNLYPYRPSVKNRCRWTFGGLYPRAYSEAVEGTDAWSMQVQCLIEGGKDSALEISLRFLHLIERTIGVLPAPCDELPEGRDPVYEAVDSLSFNGTQYQTWQEAVEHKVTIGPLTLASLLSGTKVESFTAPASHMLEPLRGPDGLVAAVVIRDQEAIEGSAEISTEPLEGSVFRLTVRIFNRTSLENASMPSRDEASMQALVATNTVMSVRDGKFFSLTDPPEALRQATAACQNRGAWPVLVGATGEHDAMLASPIILYDYPQIAPESPGDLFDGTEIDELLTLRIMTLTDEEKAMAGAMDERTRRLIARTEALAREQLAGLYGAIRLPEPAAAEAVQGGWDPFAEQRTIKSIRVDDVELRLGERVRLRPAVGGDIFDVALNGKTATIESIEQDYEDRFHVAVTLDDDPGQDLGWARQPGHRFFFKPEELAPLDDSEVTT
jgi:hypothetical protein